MWQWKIFIWVLMAACLCSLTACGAPREEAIDRGREVYLSHGCAVCHGPQGHGDGLAATNLDPRPIDLRDTSLYRQGTSASAIKQTLKFGLWNNKGAMPTYRHLSRQELKYLVIYLKSLHTATVND